MLPILFGLIAAMVFGLVGYFTYGLDGIINHTWFNQVFWLLIVVGAAISLLDEVNRCLPCRLRKRFNLQWLDQLCAQMPCNSQL